jgi:phage shock protein PspC (stress-responsive transcriptional regulator)
VERAPRVVRRARGKGGVLLGLCAGLGAHLGLDPAVIRLALLLMLFLSPAGLAVAFIYVIFALTLPVEETAL